jgi:hypothetical protein
MPVFGAKQVDLAASWLSAALKLAGYQHASEFFDVVAKSGKAVHELKPHGDAVAKILDRVRADIEAGTRLALTAEFGTGWECRTDLAAAIAALPDVLVRCTPSAEQLTAANLDPARITDAVVESASVAEPELFGRNSIGQMMLRQIVLQSYATAQQNKGFAESVLLYALREILDRIDRSHERQERIEQLLLRVSRNTQPDVTKTAVKAVTAELAPVLMREILPYLQSHKKSSVALVKTDETAGPTAQLRDMHARWVQATLSQESVKSFLAMGSAISHEIRIVQSYQSRIICLDAMLARCYIDPSEHFGEIEQLKISYFMHKSIDNDKMALSDESAIEIENLYHYSASRFRRDRTFRHLTAFQRFSRFIAEGRLFLLSEAVNRSEVGPRDVKRFEQLCEALFRQKIGGRSRSGLFDARQLQQIEQINKILAKNDSYASLITLNSKAERLRATVATLPDGHRLGDCVQSVWGPAWRCFVGQSSASAVFHSFEHLVSHVELAARYLRSFGRPEREPRDLHRSELETLQAAIVRFGLSMEPFFHALVSHYDEQQHFASEELDSWVADLLSGGRMLEEAVSKCLSLLADDA